MIGVTRGSRDSRPVMKLVHSTVVRPTRTVSLLLGLLFLMACTAGSAGYSSAEYDRRLAARLFTAGYQDIAAVYIDEVPPLQLAAAGLNELHEMDERLALHQPDDQSLQLLIDEQQVYSYPLPRPDDYSAWGGLTAAVLDDARLLSNPLLSAESEELYSAVFQGIIGELDGYSRYAGRDSAKESRASRSGFGGTDVRIRAEEDGVRVISVMEDTPAEKAGLHGDDLIIGIDGEAAADLDEVEIVTRLRGPVNSRVTLQLRRK